MGARGHQASWGGATTSHRGHDDGKPAAPGPAADPGTGEQAEDEPDVRFTLANERTFLAWNRTALRRSEPMPQSVLPRILVLTITGVAALSAVVLLVSAVR